MEETLEPAPSDQVGEGHGAAAFIGTIQRDGRTHAVIDPEATWRRLRQGAEEWYAGLARRRP